MFAVWFFPRPQEREGKPPFTARPRTARVPKIAQEIGNERRREKRVNQEREGRIWIERARFDIEIDFGGSGREPRHMHRGNAHRRHLTCSRSLRCRLGGATERRLCDGSEPPPPDWKTRDWLVWGWDWAASGDLGGKAPFLWHYCNFSTVCRGAKYQKQILNLLHRYQFSFKPFIIYCFLFFKIFLTYYSFCFLWI